jgi:hypothetical protein
MCVLIFSTTFGLKHFSFEEELSEILSRMCIGLHVKYPLILSSFNELFNIPGRFSKNVHISNFMKIHSVGAELFHSDD